MSDFGLTKEFLWQRDIMNGLKVPYVVLIGNHDCLGTGEEAYRKIFGPTNFAFIAGNVKFVCLNTNALEYDYSQPIPDFDFMEKEWTNRKEEFEKTVVSMHVHPYSGVFNNNVAKVFQYYVTQYPGLQFCTAAHNHSFSDKVPFDDGVHYIVSDCMKSRSYLVFTITPKHTSMNWLSSDNMLRLCGIALFLFSTCCRNLPAQSVPVEDARIPDSVTPSQAPTAENASEVPSALPTR